MTEMRARVIGQEKGLYRISNGNEEKLAEISGKFRYEAKIVSDYPAVGDYVIAIWPEDESNGVIEALFPRRSLFIRKAAGNGKQEQVVAANIDIVFICMSLNQNYSLRRLERYLALSWDSGATPVIVLTKADLCDDSAEKIREVSTIATGVDVIAVSSLQNDIDAIKEYLQPGKTLAFMGSSGVGKSTLINMLMGENRIATAAIGNGDKGRHTTTHRELLTLANGAYVIDTPGMRELGMWDADAGIEATFGDIEALAKQCRFSDCSHSNEPGCAIQVALEEGILSQERWESYCKLKTENAFATDGSKYLAAKEEKFKKIAKVNKANRRQGRTL